MRTHIVGTRAPVPLATLRHTTSTSHHAQATPTMPTKAPKPSPLHAGTYAVVSNALATRMQGYKHTGSTSGTVHAVFKTHAQATNYIKLHKIQLQATIVPF